MGGNAANAKAPGALEEIAIVVGDAYYVHVAACDLYAGRYPLKHDDAFLVATATGDFVPGSFDETGFYYGDTRHLSGLAMSFGGAAPVLLQAAPDARDLELVCDLANPELRTDAGTLPRETVHVRRRLWLDGPRLVEEFRIESYLAEPAELPLHFAYDADFFDVFEVRGLRRGERGTFEPPELGPDGVRFRYRGVDGAPLATRLRFEPPPATLEADGASYRLRLERGKPVEVALVVEAEGPGVPAPRRAVALPARRLAVRREAARFERAWVRVASSNEEFDRWWGRAVRDLRLLTGRTPWGPFPAAGIPWFVAPFGRDALVTAWMTLPFAPALARGIVRFLAAHRGRRHDPFTEEAPGRILHELRRGEMARARQIPFLPYYGSVDATPLFVLVATEVVRWTGDGALAQELEPALEEATRWLLEEADLDGDGLVEYRATSPIGLRNQGWKDSFDAVFHADGRLAEPPIALVEVQAYVAAALRARAETLGRAGRAADAERLRARAAALEAALEERFALEDGSLALALDAEKRPCAVHASNMGHALWCGAVGTKRAAAIVRHLFGPRLFSGWGVRTVGDDAPRYNPMSYHNGSVWPHDNALIAAGLKRYGHFEEALRIFEALYAAGLHFPDRRMPELFCGFPRVPGSGPTRYPVSCVPQAWAAASPLGMLRALLGLEVEGAEGLLRIREPVLPPSLAWIELRGFPVGEGRVDLRFERGRHTCATEILDKRGNVRIEIFR